MKDLFFRVSVQTKLFVVLGVGLIGFIIYFGVNFSILKTNDESLQDVVQSQLPALELIDDLINNVDTFKNASSQAVVNRKSDAITSSIEKARKGVLQTLQTWEMSKLPYKQEIADLGKKYIENSTKLSDIVENVLSGVSNLNDVQTQFRDSIEGMSAIERGLQAIKQRIDGDTQSAVTKATFLSRTAMGIGISILVSAMLMTIIAYFVMAGINKSLIGANGTLQSTSKRLLEIVDEAQVSSTQLRETSNRQASSCTETVISMEEMKRLLSQTSRTSGNAVELSEASFQEANNGKAIVQSLRDAMTEIDRANTALEEVNQVVKLIRERTNVINEIVFKTQMLSFNANIEAARAGQHGLGFTVVANEMGSLADMSGRAAQQINELLDRSAEQVEKTVLGTKDRITNAIDLSTRCYDFFKVLTERSGDLKKMVDSISSAAAEQNTGVDYVVNAMNDLNNTASETDRMAQGISTLADGLKSQALNLATAVNSLNSLVSGKNKADVSMLTTNLKIRGDKRNNFRESA